MIIKDLLKEKNISIYRLSKMSGIPYSTVSDIIADKAKIEKCSGETLYRLAAALGVTMEELILSSMEYRHSFEAFKSTVCHRVKDMGDIDFIINTLESDTVRKLYRKKWYPESLYLLAMLDFISRENGLPLCTEYSDIRKTRLEQTIYPVSVIAMCATGQSNQAMKDSYDHAIPEFLRFNIIEGEVRNVV